MNVRKRTPRRPTSLASGWETEETLHQLLDACDTLSHPVFLHDHEFRILFANRAYLNHAKAGCEDILGLPYWQVFPRAQGPLSSCLRALTEGAEEEVEDITTDSNEIFCCRALAIHGADGQYLYSVHLLEDVTERRRARRGATARAGAFRGHHPMRAGCVLCARH